MLNLLASFLVNLFSGLAINVLEKKKADRAIQRTLLARLIELFDSTEKLLLVAENVATEFEGYASGRETITLLVPSERLEKLHRAFQEFLKSTREIENIVGFADSELAVTIRGVRYFKHQVWKRAILTDILIPKMEKVDGKRTHLLTVTTGIPNKKSIEIFNKDATEEDAEKLLKFQVDRYLKQCEMYTVDIRNMEDLSLITSDLQVTISEMNKMLGNLRKFILDHFSLEEIFKLNEKRKIRW